MYGSYFFQMRGEFDAEDFCTVIFDEFFFTLLGSDNVIRHLLRLLWFVHPKIGNTTRLDNLMKLTEPLSGVAPTAGPAEGASIGSLSSGIGTAVSEQLVKLHTDLKAKIEDHAAALAATAPNDDKSDPFI